MRVNGISRKTGLCPRASMILRIALVLCAVVLLGGCASSGRSSVAVRHYALEYPPPSFSGMEIVSGSICVEPLSIARNYSSPSMVYRSGPFAYGDDAYNLWKVKPSVMISDLLLRDLKHAGLFRGVFSSGDTERGDYALGGVIEEFYEREETGGSQAVLALNMVLLDSNGQKTCSRLVFQKSYRSIQAMGKNDAESLARAMSRAMETLSKEIISDLYRAVRKNGDTDRRASAGLPAE